MFTDEQKNVYRNLKAPDSLREKVRTAKRPRHIRGMTVLGSLAACLILAISFGLFSGNGGPDIALNGQTLNESPMLCSLPLASDARTVPVYTFAVELMLKQPSEISVTSGTFSTEGVQDASSLAASTPITLLWETECSESVPVCELQIRDNDGITAVILTYKNAEITAEKRRITK